MSWCFSWLMATRPFSCASALVIRCLMMFVDVQFVLIGNLGDSLRLSMVYIRWILICIP